MLTCPAICLRNEWRQVKYAGSIDESLSETRFIVYSGSTRIVYFPHQQSNAADAGILSSRVAGWCQSHAAAAAAAAKLLKKKYMIHSFNFMNKAVFPPQSCTCPLAHSFIFKTQMILKVRRADWEEYKKPAQFSGSRLLSMKQCVYSIPRQDATWRQPEGIMERWRVHSNVEEMGFREWEEEPDFFFPLHPKENGIPFFDQWEKTEKILKNWEVVNWKDAGWETTEGGKKPKVKSSKKATAPGRRCYQSSNMAGSDMWSAGKGNQTDID